jgi:redox-sensitive bicupin YhaK (pirin superfamily)
MIQMTTFRKKDLAREDRGWTRAYAHMSFDDTPRGVPGWLDLGAVPLAAVQVIDPHAGYQMHHHENIQTIAMLLEGELHHEDSLGNREAVRGGELALLTAGAGIDHAEFAGNAPMRAIYFWLRQDQPGGAAGFERAPLPAGTTNRFVVIASSKRGGLTLRNDATLSFGRFAPGARTRITVEAGRRLYLVAPDSDVKVGRLSIEAGGRALIGWRNGGAGEVELTVRTATTAALLDLPA